MHVSDRLSTLADHEPVLAAPDATLRELASTLWSHSVGMVVVAEDARHPRGVCSERDVVAALARGADPDAMTAAEAMTGYVISARPEDPVFDVVFQMIDDGIRHLPIFDEAGTVVGMVSVRDLLRPLLLDALGGGESAKSGSGGDGS